jgi:HKD family nuclease
MKTLQAEGELLKQFNAELTRASKFSLGMALVTRSGLSLISQPIERCLRSGGHGSILFGVDLPTEPAAIETLLAIQARHKENFQLRRFQPGRTFFHAKISIFVRKTDVRTAIVGSSNLTEGGLSTNYETNVFIDDRRIVQEFVDYFEEHFEGAHARKIDQQWLNQYKRLWAERKTAQELQHRLREKARSLGVPPPKIPKKLGGHTFVFTGKIADWPRDGKLYPYVERHGGHVAKGVWAMGPADCLVHAEILGGRKSTQKLVRARQLKIPIITEDQFFRIARLKRH